MKALLLCVLVLVVAADAMESASYSKLNMKNTELARMVSEALLGQRQSDCSGLCIVHFSNDDPDKDTCYPGVERAACNDSEYKVGPHPDSGCYCCIS